jgi:hypothetical protein
MFIMKKIITILAFMMVISFTANAQTPIVLSKVIQVDSTKADQIYERLELYLTNSFSRPEKTIQLKDKQNHQFIVKTACLFKSVKKNAGNISGGLIYYTLNIACRDGRYKVDMIDIRHESDRTRNEWGSCDFGTLYSDVECPDKKIAFATKKWKIEIYNEMKDTAKLEFEALCNVLTDATKKATLSQDSNW